MGLISERCGSCIPSLSTRLRWSLINLGLRAKSMQTGPTLGALEPQRFDGM